MSSTLKLLKPAPVRFPKTEAFETLGEAAFAEFPAVRSPGKVIWCNFELARELGFDVPRTNQLTPELHEQLLEKLSLRSITPGETAIGEALLYALKLLAGAPAKASRQVVNVVGDGRSNAGISPAPIRDRMAEAGITINGLCILHEEPDLLQSYQREVIGGPGSFAVTCRDYADFAAAMRRKLVQELNVPIA